MTNMESKSRITKGFNLVLFLYFCFANIVDYLFEPEVKAVTPWDAIDNISPAISIIGIAIIIIITIFGGTKLFQTFWNNFISDISELRNITFYESLSIGLILGIMII